MNSIDFRNQCVFSRVYWASRPDYPTRWIERASECWVCVRWWQPLYILILTADNENLNEIKNNMTVCGRSSKCRAVARITDLHLCYTNEWLLAMVSTSYKLSSSWQMFGALNVLLIAFKLDLLENMALWNDWWVEKPFYRRKNSLVVGGIRTRALANSMAIVASALTTVPPKVIQI